MALAGILSKSLLQKASTVPKLTVLCRLRGYIAAMIVSMSRIRRNN